MNVCIDPRASLESGVGEHAGKAITAFPGDYVEGAKVAMEGLYCGTNEGKMYFPPTQKCLRRQQYKEKGAVTGVWEPVQLRKQGSRWLAGMRQESGRRSPRGGGGGQRPEILI